MDLKPAILMPSQFNQIMMTPSDLLRGKWWSCGRGLAGLAFVRSPVRNLPQRIYRCLLVLRPGMLFPSHGGIHHSMFSRYGENSHLNSHTQQSAGGNREKRRTPDGLVLSLE